MRRGKLEMSQSACLIGGLLVASVSCVGCSAAGAPTTVLPAHVSVAATTCTEDAAILAGWRVADQASPQGVTDEEAVAFRVSADGSVHQSELGGGMLTSISSPDNRTAYAVRRHWFPDRPEEGVLFRSDDYGLTWQLVPTAPPGLIGVAFGSPAVGFVWSRSHIYHTSDEGRTWSGVESPGPLPWGEPVPRLDGSGALWIAAGHNSEFNRQHNAIARVAPDLGRDSALVGSDFSVWAMDVGDDGALWLLTRVEPGPGSVNVLRLAPGRPPGDLKKVAEFPNGLPQRLRVFGQDIIAVIAKPFAVPNYAYEMVSRDAGATWRKVTPRATDFDEVCFVSAQSSWIVRPAGAIYSPRGR
jgi:hypothetical protein